MRTRWIEAYQIKNLHILKAALGLDDETYRLALSQFKTPDNKIVASTKELQYHQAGELTAAWIEACKAAGIKVYLARAPKETIRYMTAQQKGKLWYHALRCAAVYADLPSVNAGAVTLSGEDLRNWVLARMDAKMELPNVIMEALFAYIDRVSKRFLIEGGFIKRPDLVKTTRIYWQHVQEEEAQYLIQRWVQIHESVDKREATAKEPMRFFNN
ncbi:MAG TPA: hypothetical protein PLW14_09135 [Chlorobiota bacterium]|nr:hypothetical protein [Chlorobiota bacterium]